MELLKEYIVPIISVVVWVVIEALKKIPYVKEKQDYIPILALCLGVVFNFWMNNAITFQTFAYGAISGFGATGLDQLIKIPAKVKANEQIAKEQ